MDIEHIRAYRPWVFPVREERYTGTGLSWSIDDLAPIDRDAIVTFYEKIGSLMGLDLWQTETPESQRDVLHDWATREGWRQCWRDVAALGPESYILQGSHKLLHQVIHDLRGGPMTSLVMNMSLLLSGRDVDVSYIWLLARDVRKIARNCFPDLDQVHYDVDRGDNPHSVRLLGEKWSRVRRGGGVEVHMDFKGNIATSCLEFSALDRTLYNLMNNALRESASDDEAVTLFMVTERDTDDPEDVRFWIRNPLHPQQYKHLTSRFGEDLSDLFLSPFSTTGSGMGMQIVCDFVGKAYGVSAKRAIQMGLVGVALEASHFNVWFHWPTVD